jgi:hypothetical protein
MFYSSASFDSSNVSKASRMALKCTLTLSSDHSQALIESAPLDHTQATLPMERKEIESTVIRGVLKTDNDKDVYDMIEEVDNLIAAFKDYKVEILEDMCQVFGLQVDR